MVDPKLMAGLTPTVASKLMAGSRPTVDPKLMAGLTPTVASKLMVGSKLMAGLRPTTQKVDSKLMAERRLMVDPN